MTTAQPENLACHRQEMEGVRCREIANMLPDSMECPNFISVETFDYDIALLPSNPAMAPLFMVMKGIALLDYTGSYLKF